MIDARKILLRLTPVSPGEALDLVTEMGTVLNTIAVQLRGQGYDTGEHREGTLSNLLFTAWSKLYTSRPLLVELAKRPKPLPVDAPIWIGDEPPLDKGPSPV